MRRIDRNVCSRHVVQNLEARRLLTAAIEVWGGDADFTGQGNAWDLYTSIDQQGFTKLGESNAAGATPAFSGATAWNYFVIAVRDRTQIDAIRGSDLSYVNWVPQSGNADDPGNVMGAADGQFTTVGTQYRGPGATYGGYIVIANPGGWTGITLTTGTIQPLVQVHVSEDLSYVPGVVGSADADFRIHVEDYGMMTAGRFSSPRGVWEDLSQQGDDGWEYSPDQIGAQAADLYGLYPAGTYTVEITTPLGTQQFGVAYNMPGTSDPITWPTQVPNITFPAYGGSTPTTTFAVQWDAMTDPNVNAMYVSVRDASDNEIYGNWSDDTSATTTPPITASADTSYVAQLEFDDSQWSDLGNGISFQGTRSHTMDLPFRVAPVTNPLPDMAVRAFTYPAGSYPQGASITGGGGIDNLGQGTAICLDSYGKGVPLYLETHLSTDQIWGNADDVTVFRFAPSSIQMGGSGGAGNLPFVIPIGTPAGNYYVAGKIDADNTCAESNEANNITWSATADITVTSSVASGFTTISGGVVTVNGNSASDGITLWQGQGLLWAQMNGVMRTYLASGVSGVRILGNGGNDYVYASSDPDGANIVTGSANDTITVGPDVAATTIDGGLGDDLITGGDANDSLRGDGGNDTIIGGLGDDTIMGNTGDDSIIAGAGADSVMAGLGADTLTGGTGNDTLLAGDGRDSVIGGDGDDWIEGRGKQDTIYADAGNDTIYGGAGSDLIYGGAGDDRIDVGVSTAFHDTVDGGPGSDLIRSDADDVLTNCEGVWPV